MKNTTKKIISILQVLAPSTRTEWRIWVFLIIYFSIICIPFCYTAQPNMLGMMGYDTAGHLTVPDMMINTHNMLNWNLRHPLFRLLYLPVILLNEGVLFVGIDLTWPLFLGTSVLLMSLSGLFIYKSLKAIDTPTLHSILLLALFCSFAHTIILSIQVDSFVMSLFFGSIMILLFVTGKHNTLSDNLLFLGITGTTSTNCFKVAFYHLVEERSLKKATIRFLKAIPLFCVLFALTFPNLIERLIERPRGLIYAIWGDSFSFQGSGISKCKLFLDNFLSEPIVFHHTTGIIYSHETTNLPAYPSLWCYLPITIIFLSVLLSIIINRHHRLVQLFCYCFSFDLLMHFGIGYGMEESQLFCGHWLFFLPTILGLLIINSPKQKRLFELLLIICIIFFFTTNIIHYFMSIKPAIA